MGHQRPAIDVEWADLTRCERKPLIRIPFKRLRLMKSLGELLLDSHNTSHWSCEKPTALYTAGRTNDRDFRSSRSRPLQEKRRSCSASVAAICRRSNGQA